MSESESLGEFRVEIGASYIEGQRWASIKLGNTTIFSELVFDNEKTPAQENIVHLFAARLRRVLEGE